MGALGHTLKPHSKHRGEEWVPAAAAEPIVNVRGTV
jgi:hypothetical protein